MEHSSRPWRRRIWVAVSGIVVVATALGLYWFQPWKLVTSTTVNEALPSLTAAPVAAERPPAPVTTARTTTAQTTPATADTTTPATTATAIGADTITTQTADKEAPATLVTAAPTATSKHPAAPATTAARGRTSVAGTAAARKPPPLNGPVQLLAGELLSHEHQTSGTVRLVELPDGRRVVTLENLATSDGPDVHVWLAKAAVQPSNNGWYVFDDQEHVDLGRLKGNLGNQVYAVPDDLALTDYGSVSLWCERFSVSFGAAALV